MSTVQVLWTHIWAELQATNGLLDDKTNAFPLLIGFGIMQCGGECLLQ